VSATLVAPGDELRDDHPAAPSRVAPARWVAARLHLALPGLLTVYLGFNAGGYFPGSTGWAAVLVALCLVVRLTLAERPLAGWSLWSSVGAGAAGLLAAWVLLSGSWSGAEERALLEFDRALLYLLTLVLFATFPWSEGALAAVLRWVLVAFVAIAVAGVLARLAPDLVHGRETVHPERLSYPVTYWNGMGVLCALGLVLALHVAASPWEAAWTRVLATGAMPALAVALYCTFSRGAILAGLIGLVAYALLARPARLPWALLVGGIATWVAVRAAYGADAIGTARYASPAGVAEGHDVLRTVVLATVAALLARGALIALERRAEGWARRWPVPRREVRLAALAGAVAVLALGAVAAGAPGAARDQVRAFERGNVVPKTANQRDRLGFAGNNGRLVLWNTALDVYREAPLHGSGAGTYRLDWLQRRDDPFYLVSDAHSLYVETLAELGWPGLLLVCVLLVSILAGAARGVRGPRRHAAAAVLAAGLALAIHAGVDWDWELPVLWIWLFACGGLVLASARGRLGELPRLARVVAGLMCLLVALTPWSVARSQGSLQRSVHAFARGDCTTAIDGALDAIGAVSARAEPFEILAWCDSQSGWPRLAESAMRSAQARDPDNWQYAYGLAVLRARAGEDPRPQVRRAVRLNPRYDQVRWLARAMRGDRPARWRRAAARAPLPVDRGTPTPVVVR
jgi:O-Antigen ligase